MITVISGTNRKGGKTHIFAKHYTADLRSKMEETVNFVSMEDIQNELLNADMYNPNAMSEELRQLQENSIVPAEKFVFVVPEYNGSIPGIVKLFIDALSVRKYKESFAGKKALLVGVASGRSGCLRGMDHMTGILNHVGVSVMPNKLPISSIGIVLNENNEIDEATKVVINNHIDSFLQF